MIDISPSFIIAVFIYFVTGNGILAFAAYVSALLHELSHVLVAFLFGYKLKRMSAFACGFCATFKKFKNPPFIHEVTVALAGPVMNLMLALTVITAALDYGFTLIAVKINIYMFAINLLPILPLDGGRIVYAFLKNEMSGKRAEKLMSVISVSVALITLLFGISYAFNSKENISLLIAAIYILSNISLRNEVNIEDNRVDSVKKIKVYSCDKDSIISDVILKTGINQNILIFVTDSDGNIYGYITGGEIKKAAFENRYSEKILMLSKEITNGGIFNGN